MRGGACSLTNRAVRLGGSAGRSASGPRPRPAGDRVHAHASEWCSGARCRPAPGRGIGASHASAAAPADERRRSCSLLRHLSPSDHVVGVVATGGSRSPSDDRCRHQAAVATRPCGTSQAGSYVVKCSDQLNLGLAGESVPSRSRPGRPARSRSPCGHSGRCVGSQLVPRRAQDLKRLFERSERVGGGGMASRLRRSRLESPRVLDQLGRAPAEVFSKFHGAMFTVSDQA